MNAVDFLWPKLLWLLLALPLLVLLYFWLLRRRKKAALAWASLGVVKEALAGGGGNWRRHLPPLLFLGGLAALVLAMARPAGGPSFSATPWRGARRRPGRCACSRRTCTTAP